MEENIKWLLLLLDLKTVDLYYKTKFKKIIVSIILGASILQVNFTTYRPYSLYKYTYV